MSEYLSSFLPEYSHGKEVSGAVAVCLQPADHALFLAHRNSPGAHRVRVPLGAVVQRAVPIRPARQGLRACIAAAYKSSEIMENKRSQHGGKAMGEREGKGREGKGREGKGREGKGRKGREGKGREGKGREGKGRGEGKEKGRGRDKEDVK